nr:MAG TPA: hypothetical protein [Caudoviricetes sp.]
MSTSRVQNTYKRCYINVMHSPRLHYFTKKSPYFSE